ncbi:MAG: Co2+/Mg2+ efflux protein ApaG [Bacteroidia bacterium]|nr:Co2+/Mg2+ efflux protein ApaG [Bacteroidia bacterium]
MGTYATEITHGIKISVEAKFQPDHSVIEQRHFLFSYRITIENASEYTVQLLSRHWDIFDSSGDYDIVEGEGVVGEQPVLEPGESFEYESACSLTTDMGKMKGTYLMERKVDKAKFHVNIPEFELIIPQRLN